MIHKKEPAASVRQLTAEEADYVTGGVAMAGTGINGSSSGTGATLAVDGGTGQADDHGSGTGIA